MSLYLPSVDHQMYDVAWGLISNPPDIIWNPANIRMGIGTFNFNRSATVRPAVIGSVKQFVNAATQPGALSFTNNSVTLITEFIDIRTQVLFHNAVLFDDTTSKPLMWYDFGEDIDISRRSMTITPNGGGVTPSNVVIRFNPGYVVPINIMALPEVVI